ncbi:PTS sugar transporter subunit IIB [Companilactobacillus sp. DQM5]|uniref:PTS sugar transporter subunit IIB n=1 Tax=Companilactobacillus sp. DQM5 TaxID=3463359 RepID=UPI0040585A08
MAEKTIMLVCSAGMSTSLLVTKMQKSAEEKGIKADIFATAASDANAKLEEKNPDILMLGPQVKYMENDFKSRVDIPVVSINMQDYGMMNGEKVLETALETMD